MYRSPIRLFLVSAVWILLACVAVDAFFGFSTDSEKKAENSLYKIGEGVHRRLQSNDALSREFEIVGPHLYWIQTVPGEFDGSIGVQLIEKPPLTRSVNLADVGAKYKYRDGKWQRVGEVDWFRSEQVDLGKYLQVFAKAFEIHNLDR